MLIKTVRNLLAIVVSKYKQLSRKKKVLVIVLIVVLIFSGFALFRKITKPPKYTLEKAKFDSVVELVSETGNVTSAGAVPIYSTTTGMVDEMFVQNGDYVLEGSVLFSVKSSATKMEQDTALANYLAAKNELEAAKSTQLSLQADMFGEWDTFKNLAEGDTYENDDGTPRYSERAVPEFHIPEKDWLAAEKVYKDQQQVISKASAHVSADWAAYQATQDSEVKAQIDGEVRNLSVTKGDLVEVPAVLTVSGITPSLYLVDNDVQTAVKVDVNETDINKVQLGQSADVEFDAVAGKTFLGKVGRIDTISPSTSGNIVKFAVYIIVDGKSDLIKRGLTADVEIKVADKDNVLTVPSSAVKPYQGGKAVRMVGDKDEIKFTPVEVGAKGGGRIEILSGIEEGDEVVAALSNDQVERKSGLF